MLYYCVWLYRATRKYLWNVETLVFIIFLFLAYQYLVNGESLRTLIRKARVKV